MKKLWHPLVATCPGCRVSTGLVSVDLNADGVIRTGSICIRCSSHITGLFDVVNETAKYCAALDRKADRDRNNFTIFPIEPEAAE